MAHATELNNATKRIQVASKILAETINKTLPRQDYSWMAGGEQSTQLKNISEQFSNISKYINVASTSSDIEK